MKIIPKRVYVTLCIFVVVLLSSCARQDIYYDRKFNPPVYFGTHVVRQGETLYSIARRYGRDFKELARENSISSPYVISPGQKIQLERSNWSQNALEKRGSSASRKNVNVTKGKEANEIRKNVTKIKKHKDSKNIEWSWPHLGPIIAKYKIKGQGATPRSERFINKGIDIGGANGDPILAAAAGEVVYAGNGLLGYGNLVIINHSAQYLSAYAHNRKLLVQEGQAVKAGDKIAEMGSSGVERTKLHFEIRRNGQPVNPLGYLPRK